ncbi:MAG: hypothetical protein KGJ59_03010 [Bacteroidota bacterium]|nr:hypothetical protein [Bacteroidota bacterium]
MKSLFSNTALIAACTLAALAVSSCNKKPQPPVIKEWTLYQDPFYGFELQYPKDWLVNAEANRIRLYSSQEVATRFYNIYADPTAQGPDGVEVTFGFQKFKDAGATSLDSFVVNAKNDMANYSQLGQEQPGMLGGETGVEVPYKTKFSSKVSIYGRRTMVTRDSVFFYVNFAGFNDEYQLYDAVFDTILASIKLPKMRTSKTNAADETKPSQTLTTFSNNYIEMKYPDNFEYKLPAKQGDQIFAISFAGYRQDCTIELDIRSANKWGLDKIFDGNKGMFKPKSTGDATIDGNAAKYLTASPAPKISRRVYFTVKNNQVYRVIFTWYQPMQNDYWPIFEKSLNSLKLK